MEYDESEDRQKLCFYAAVKAKVPLIDYDYIPTWRANFVPPVEDQERSWGLLCKGLPDFYVIRKTTLNPIEIRFVQSPVDHYNFKSSKITPVRSVTLSKF